MKITTSRVTEAASWGPDDPEVERIWLLLKDAVRLIDNEKMKGEADLRADRIDEKLNSARNYYKATHAHNFSDRPTSEQESEYDALYAALWSAYKDRLPRFASSIGYEIGFMFARDQFDAQAEAFARRHPQHSWLVQYARTQKANWHEGLRDQRNAKEHDGDLRDMPNATDINNAAYAKHLFKQVTDAVEGIAISLVSYKLPPQWNIVIVNPEADVFVREQRYKIRHAFEGPSLQGAS